MFNELVLFHFQTKSSDTHDYTYLWAILFITWLLYLKAILFIGIMFLYIDKILRQVKANNETTTLLTCFTYNMALH